MTKYLIINADDFGWDEETVAATIKLFEKGVLTSATIMTGMPGTPKAIEYAKKNQDRFSFGLHFNIVDGHASHSLSPNSLTTPENRVFKDSNQQRINALMWKLNKKDIQHELECQLSQLFDAGINVSHIDSHGHLHKFPQIIHAAKPILKKYKITSVRIPQNIFQNKNLKKSLINNIFRLFFGGTKHPDYFFMLEHHEDSDWLEKFLNDIPDGLTELGIHPGTTDAWRAVETQPFFHDEILKKLNRPDLNLVNYNFIDRR
ncbi:carbohydrate deacetylase [Hydrogenimonas cancrithermarum]|uniref:Hydrolase n=1 Tax=Hydrogenimonas cancrithermarum TaxID=2993563 RepID=A0ABN6WZ69_9BACT|nr:ChbG/HpnK family deacetylase [Hydrogenimonas cancrithermarum]BDY13537.1 hydrolase [Hydrogenimonas cancrithermarum]